MPTLPMPALTAQILHLQGPDAIAFAQAQFASDVDALRVGHWQWSAWLNARGRVRHVAQLARPDPDRLLLLLRGGAATTTAAELTRYVLRQRLTVSAQAPCALVDAPALAVGMLAIDGGRITLGMGDHALCIAPLTDAAVGQPQRWRQLAIEADQAWLPTDALEAWLAPGLGLIDLGAVRRDKGCYPGQEIVARLHHRGGNKQHLYRIHADTPLMPGTKLRLKGAALGQILDAVTQADGTSVALAVARDNLSPGTTLQPDDMGPISITAAQNDA